MIDEIDATRGKTVGMDVPALMLVNKADSG